MFPSEISANLLRPRPLFYSGAWESNVMKKCCVELYIFLIYLEIREQCDTGLYIYLVHK